MSRKTFYIIAAIWFVLLILVIAGSFIPGVDPNIQSEVRKYVAFVVIVGALCMMLIRRKIK